MEGRGGAGRELASELAVGGDGDGQVGPDVGAAQGEAEPERDRRRAGRRRRARDPRPARTRPWPAAAVIGRADRTANGDAFTTGSSKSHRLQSPAASAGASGLQFSPSSRASGCRRPSGRTTANPTSPGAAPSVAAARTSATTRTRPVHRGRSLAGAAEFSSARPQACRFFAIHGQSCRSAPSWADARRRSSLSCGRRAGSARRRMSIHVALTHRTSYRYDRPVTLSPQIVRLRPAPHCRTPILGYSLRIAPETHFLNWQQDPHGNYLARLVFPDADAVAGGRGRSRRRDDGHQPVRLLRRARRPSSGRSPTSRRCARDLAPVPRRRPRRGRACGAWLASIPRRKTRTARLPRRPQPAPAAGDIGYVIRMEPGVQTPEETLEKRQRLVPRHRLAAGAAAPPPRLRRALRLGLPDPARAGREGARRPVGHRRRFHRSARLGRGLPAGRRLDRARPDVRAARRRRPHPARLHAGAARAPRRSPAPSTSARSSSRTTWRVQRVFEAPRVTKPYTEEQWARDRSRSATRSTRELRARRRAADDGRRADLRVDRRSRRRRVEHRGAGPDASACWRARCCGGCRRASRRAACCTTARASGIRASRCRAGRSAATGAHDGEPIWHDDDADRRRVAGPRPRRRARRSASSRRWRRGSASSRRARVPGYEDVWYYLWKERRLPVNVDPLDARRSRRRRGARRLRPRLRARPEHRGRLRAAAGPPRGSRRAGRLALAQRAVVLPRRASVPDPRRLADGLSPAARQPAVGRGGRSRDADRAGSVRAAPAAAVAARAIGRTDAPRRRRSAVRRAAGDRRRCAAQTLEPRDGERDLLPRLGESAAGIVRTALCVEPRDGRLHVFLPPVRTAEDYLDLIAAIEDDRRARCAMPVILEGEPPPRRSAAGALQGHARPRRDRGQPAAGGELGTSCASTRPRSTRRRGRRASAPRSSWSTAATPAPAAATTSCSAAPTPADSPLLRRPDLLRSLIAYWHNHPSLSYLFSGMFIGPTSQAPRVDEARDDQVARARDRVRPRSIEREPTAPPPWLVDRIFRNLLIDVTGNTHRAEFCIDKLYCARQRHAAGWACSSCAPSRCRRTRA